MLCGVFRQVVPLDREVENAEQYTKAPIGSGHADFLGYVPYVPGKEGFSNLTDLECIVFVGSNAGAKAIESGSKKNDGRPTRSSGKRSP